MFLLYSRKTQKTGKLVAQVLQIDFGQTPPSSCPKILIRWGSSINLPYTPRKEINSQAAVLLAADKLSSLQTLIQKKISVPELFLLNEDVTIDKFPILARTRTHQQGTDIILCLQKTDIERAIRLGRSYGLRYIPTAREYRIHVFNGKSIKVSQKIWTDTTKVYKPWVRNHLNGHTFRIPETPLDETSRALAKAAVKALKLDFGAVDLIVDDKGESFILEVNTGPGLVRSGIKKYCTHLAKKLKITSLDDTLLNSLRETEND